MADDDPILNPLPYAVRPKLAQLLAGHGKHLLWQRLNDGTYQSFLDGTNRMIVTQSILDHQKRLAKEQRGTPATKPSKRRGRRRKIR
jgi:hypothetical protein